MKHYPRCLIPGVSSLLLDDALKPATPLSNGAISGVAGLSASSSSKVNILKI